MPGEHALQMGKGATLVDVLDRILDKGLVVAGDVKISLADVELLTIRIRLIICSVDKAESIGMDWWRADPYFSSAARLGSRPTPEIPPAAGDETARLAGRLDDLEGKLSRLLEERGARESTNDAPSE